MIYTVTSKKFDDVWEGSLDELFEVNAEIPSKLRNGMRALRPGEKLDCVVHGVSYAVSCREDGPKLVTTELSQEESMARAVESLLDALRQRGVSASDTDVDLSGYEAWRAAHPRQDA